jgi:hypothetical protein
MQYIAFSKLLRTNVVLTICGLRSTITTSFEFNASLLGGRMFRAGVPEVATESGLYLPEKPVDKSYPCIPGTGTVHKLQVL